MRSILREFIESVISEIDMSDVKEVCYADGSTHVMKTCKIGDKGFHLKFSEASLFDVHDPSLQILVEYLAYRIYGLYTGVHVPEEIHLVYDKKKSVVGLATLTQRGQTVRYKPKELGELLSQGIFVDVLLANWDVVAHGNYIPSKDKVTRIDPGGSLTFRAQGGRKNKNFGDEPGELKTMLDPSSGTPSSAIISKADMKKAVQSFTSVTWEQISTTIDAVDAEISAEISEHMPSLLDQWKSDAKEIKSKLAKRHAAIMKHVEFVNNV
jgi:hypothetical protein